MQSKGTNRLQSKVWSLVVGSEIIQVYILWPCPHDRRGTPPPSLTLMQSQPDAAEKVVV